MLKTEATKRFLREPRLLRRDYLYLASTEYQGRPYFIAETKCGRTLKRMPSMAASYHWPVGKTEEVHKTAAGTKIALKQGGWPSHAASAFIQNVPENWRDESDAYNYQRRRLPITDYTVIKLNLWPAERMVFADKATEFIFRAELAGLEDQDRGALQQADFKLHGSIPLEVGGLKRDNLESREYPLKEYQQTAVALSMRSLSYALFMEQGTGKTATAVGRVNVEATRLYKEHNRTLRVLVVCPSQVRLNWVNEFQKFGAVPGYVARVDGAQMKRLETVVDANSPKRLKGKAFTCCVTSFDAFSNDLDIYSLVAWDLVIYDESHYFKNSTTKRFKAIRKFRDNMNAHEKREDFRPFMALAMTGTPITNHALDLFAQLEGIGEGASGFYTWKGFKGFHAEFIDVGQTATGGAFKKLARLANVPLLQERLSRLSFRITKKEAMLNLPDKVYDVFEATMTPKQLKIYDKLATELFAQIEDDLSGEINTMEASNILTRLLRLSQITSGHVKYDDADKAVQINENNNPKVDALMNLLLDENKTPAQKTIVWAIYREDIRVIERALKLHNDNPARKGPKLGFATYFGDTPTRVRDQEVHRFNNDPECRVFIANPKCAGAGLNLLGYNPENPEDIGEINYSVTDAGVEEIRHSYTAHEVFFSQSFSMTERSQAEDRAHRIGCKMNLRITDLMVPGSIDEEIRKRVQGKIQNANVIQDLRNILSSLREASL